MVEVFCETGILVEQVLLVVEEEEEEEEEAAVQLEWVS
jgi:hypothetical protein